MLYEYYANTLNPIIDKRNFDEIDRLGMDRLNKRFFLERPKQTQYDQQQRFREIDHNDYHDYVKRMLNDDRSMRSNAVAGSSALPREYAKRNFDEIDRFGPDVFADSKRSVYRGGAESSEEDEINKSKYQQK